MRQKHAIDLETARKVAAAAEYEALKHGLQVVVAIVDEGGHLIYLQRDAAQPGSVEVAIGKAKSALLFRRSTRAFEELVESGRQGYLAMRRDAARGRGTARLPGRDCRRHRRERRKVHRRRHCRASRRGSHTVVFLYPE